MRSKHKSKASASLNPSTITWLHLSDLHACPNKTGWDASHVIKSLVDDLKELHREYKLRPDLVFFTGDAAFGHLGDSPGESLQDQYKSVQEFLNEVRRAFRPELSPRDLYLVPGNHDVNRDDIDEAQTLWLRDPRRSLSDIVSMMQAGSIQWRRYMERLEDYKLFLKTNGYDHLLIDDKNRLIYADERELAGLRVGIVGLNSAWSCYGGDDDKARLWCGGKYQIEDLRPLLSKSDFSIALIHHPGNWFVSKEDPNVQRLLEGTFQFVLHGHEHQGWVRTEEKTGHTVIWAGPCYDSSEKQNGFNFVQLDRKTGEGKVWLREYKETGRGWVAHNIKTLAPNGIWPLNGLKWFRKFSQTEQGKKRDQIRSKSAGRRKLPILSTTTERALERINVFERRFCEAIVRKYDYLELFGADIPRESQRHSLSVAYVSLNLSEDADEERAATARTKRAQVSEAKLGFIGAGPVAAIFDYLSESPGRLLIRGTAGGGKSTLLRWAAIESGRFNLEYRDAFEGDAESEPSPSDISVDNTEHSPGKEHSIKSNWRTRIPFLIRLRDCPSGALPRPKDWPALIAKELPDPPADWIDRVLTSGRALVLLDGVDEVPVQRRDSLAREIENLIGAYPQNYWIVSTRPGAVAKGWLSKLNFLEARIEPMSLGDQGEFIDKWYSAVAAELRSTARRAENLEKLAVALKHELRETPGIARLATYPLLCAMICALYRERNQKLPETQAALCEDLCKMLLHRRERETPEMSLIHLPPDYRKLDYEHKKYIVSELAKNMVDTGVSSLHEDKADSLIANALNHFPDHAGADAQEMRRSLVERSGLLRPSGTNRIDFLHNTLKEYLAAGRFVSEGAHKLLASRADDDTWQPVILFAAALPTPGFASKLMTELLNGLPRFRRRGTKSGAANRKVATRRRSREFFVVRCRNSSFRLEPELVQRVALLAEGLFPPNTIADAEVLADLGEIVVPHLNPRQRAGARQKVACIRALRLIGGPKAKAVLKSFVPGKAKSVLVELMGAAADLNISLKLTASDLDFSSTSISNLNPLSGCIGLRSLNLAGTRVEDLGPLFRLKGLHEINVSRTAVRNLSPLAQLKSLRLVDVSLTKADLSTLRGLRSLQGLRVNSPIYFRRSYYYWSVRQRQAYDLSLLYQTLNGSHFIQQVLGRYHHFRGPRPLEHRLRHSKRVTQIIGAMLTPQELSDMKVRLPLLEHLDHVIGLSRMSYEMIATIIRTPNVVERLLYYEPKAFYSHLRINPYGQKQVRWRFDEKEESESLLTPLAQLRNLQILDLTGTPFVDFTPLSSMSKLKVLLISNTLAVDFSPLSSLRELKWLELADTLVRDFTPLKKLTKLQVLDLSSTAVSDLSFLKPMKHLEVLSLTNTEVSNVEPLLDLPSLKYLFVFRPARTDRTTRTTLRASLRLLTETNRNVQIFNQW